MSSELKPCPFCGGEAYLSEQYGTCFVRCKECGAMGGAFDNAGDAKSAWNNRTEGGE